jgi:hypothetical protein
MMPLPLNAFVLGVPVLLALTGSSATAGAVPEKYRPMIAKGLEWLANRQARDGHWTGNDDQYRVALTALAGMAFTMEGSTNANGKYAPQVRNAVDWLVTRSRKDGAHAGLIGDPDIPAEASLYMFGHGFAMKFLAEVYGEEENRDKRDQIKDVLQRAVTFGKDNQSKRGGWFYTSHADSGGADEMAVTLVQHHALRGVRNAGIVVPKETLKKCEAFQQLYTMNDSGLSYRGPSKRPAAMEGFAGGRPALTAGALACAFPEGAQLRLTKKWLLFCRNALPLAGSLGREDEFAHYFYGPVVLALGDAGWGKLFPDYAPEDHVTWTRYRAARFDWLMKQQNADGSWTNPDIGPVYATAMHLLVLQLDNTVRLPLTPR